MSSLNDKPTELPNTENASIQAIAGSQYNYDNRVIFDSYFIYNILLTYQLIQSVHTVWSSGQYVSHVSAMESAQEVTSYNNDDAENSSTMVFTLLLLFSLSSHHKPILYF